jgi:hypothetical protein
MIYIQTALKPEAQAFVDYFKLKKSKLKNYTLFSNESIRLIISGMGVDAARAATQTLINHYDIRDDDCYCNIGIAAASRNFALGELVLCGGVNYRDIEYRFLKENPLITTFDTAQEEICCELADMESFGFYDAVIHNPAIKKFYILKVVSDYFEPQKVSKELAKSLLFAKMQTIETIIKG